MWGGGDNKIVFYLYLESAGDPILDRDFFFLFFNLEKYKFMF